MDNQLLPEDPQPQTPPEPPPASMPPPPPVPFQREPTPQGKRAGEFLLGCFGMLAVNVFLVMIAGAITYTMNDTDDLMTIFMVLLLLINLAAIFSSFTILKRPYVAYGIITLLAASIAIPLLVMGICMMIVSRSM